MKEKKNKQVLIGVLSILLMTIFLLGASYAYWLVTKTQIGTNLVDTLKCLDISLTEETNAINLQNEYAIDNEDGMKKEPYTFTIKNTCTNPISADITLEVLSATTIGHGYIRSSLNEFQNTNDNSKVLTGYTLGTPTISGATSYKLKQEIILNVSQSKTYDLRLWIDGATTMEQGMNKTFQSKIVVIAKPFTTIVATPTNLTIDITEGMIPVVYNPAGQTVKADSSKTDGSWYDYSAYKWANAVLVTATNRITYQNAAVGTVINEADILAYYVWIPRFSYTLWNINANGSTYATERQIAVTLQTTSDTVHKGTTNGDELTHPAFWWDKDDDGTRENGEELNGFWVGKYELTGSVATPTIKPNVTSLRTQTVSSFWTIIEKFKTNASYGLNGSSLDSHMMKNMEWGAVAYLSNSQYGNRANPATGNEIYTNPSSSYITGRSGNAVSQGSTTDTSGAASVSLYSWNGKSCSSKTLFECTGTIQGVYGPSSSTTGTIYGVYDMSGGTNEYVMGNMAESTTNYNNKIMYPSSAGTVFASYTDMTIPKRYYDIYDYGATYNGAAAYSRGKLGDATKEVVISIGSLWNDDYANFLNLSGSWFIRGSAQYASESAGVYSSDPEDGDAYSSHSCRAVLNLE